MSLIKAITTVGGYTMISRITGFARDILIAGFLGAGVVSDAFFVAFKFPNLFRRLFAEGAFNAAFIPLFARELEDGTVDDPHLTARRFAEQSFAALAFFLLVFVAALEVAMPWAIYVFAPGFAEVEGKLELAAGLTRITMPYLLFISLVALQSGVLNALGKFAAAAATPIFLNICLIAALLLHGYAPGVEAQTPGHALAWGVFTAGVVQFIWLYWHCRRHGMPLRLVRPRLTPRVKTLIRRIVPGAIGAGVYQVNLLVDTMLASLVASGAVSYLYYADRVTQLPLGVVGVAVGTALLPLLSRQLKAGDLEAAAHNTNRALEFALLLTLPAAIALMVISDSIIRVLFERGAFDAEARAATSLALAAFALGLPAYVLVKVLAPGFFAREDTRTPVKVAAVALVINIILNLALMWWLKHVGIALATSASAWINALALGMLLKKRGFLALDNRLKYRLPRIIAACGIMAATLAAGRMLLAPWLSQSSGLQILALAALVIAGMGAYFISGHLLGAARLSDLKGLRRRG